MGSIPLTYSHTHTQGITYSWNRPVLGCWMTLPASTHPSTRRLNYRWILPELERTWAASPFGTTCTAARLVRIWPFSTFVSCKSHEEYILVVRDGPAGRVERYRSLRYTFDFLCVLKGTGGIRVERIIMSLLFSERYRIRTLLMFPSSARRRNRYGLGLIRIFEEGKKYIEKDRYENLEESCKFYDQTNSKVSLPTC